MTKRLLELVIAVAFFVVLPGKAYTYWLSNSKTSSINLRFHYATPVITESGSPGSLNTTYGTASSAGSFTIGGTNMAAGILVTPPAGFEVSTNNATFSATITVGAAGNIPNAPVYVRLIKTTASGNYSGNIITLTSTGASTVNVTIPNSTVSKAPLTVTANNASKSYGTTLTGGGGSNAFTSNGLQNGETIGSVSIGYGSGSQPTDGVATYSACVTIANATGGSFTANNYNITYVNANIIVNPAPLVIMADDITKIYGATLTGGSGSSAFTAVGLQNGETVGTVTIGYGTGSASSDVVGKYLDCVTIAAATGGNFSAFNYSITYIPGKITVVPALLTVNANDITKKYGDVLTGGPGSTAFTSSGLKNGETIGTVTVGYGTGGAANAHVGTCNACVTAASATGGTFNPFNYSITYTPGNIIITPASLTIIADDKIKLYGEAVPLLTVTYNGLLNGDTPAQLTSQPVASTTATAISPPGQYSISVSGGSSPDYNINYISGILTITESYAIPNTFTPNGDGINDTWHIQFLDSYQDCTVSIFNRLGQSVFYTNGYPMAWDGTYRGAALPTGVYYYVISLKNVNKLLSGYVTIIR